MEYEYSLAAGDYYLSLSGATGAVANQKLRIE
jgi:hypothetical protein